MSPMHPFFHKASLKTTGKPPTLAKSEDATSTTEETYSPGSASTPHEQDNEDSPISVPSSQPGDIKPRHAANHKLGSDHEKEQVEVGISGDFTIDLNLDRRKRRKLRPSTESQMLAHGHENDWLRRLAEGDVARRASAPMPTSAAIPLSSSSLKSRRTVHKPAASPWKSPRRTGKKTLKGSSSMESMTNEAAINASEPPTTLPTKKATPQKKLLKLNANGKLLSSPATFSPVTKSKGKKGNERDNDVQRANKVVLKYGTDQEGRVRIGMKINEVISKTSLSRRARLAQKDAAPKATHPFFLGQHAQAVESTVRSGLSDTLREDQVSAVEDHPSSLRTTVAWKDIVFTSQKPTFTKTADATGAPWPPIDIQHLGTKITESPLSHTLKLRGAASSKSKEQSIRITAEEDIMQCFSNLLQSEAKLPTHRLRLPQRIVSTGQQVLAKIDDASLSTQTEPNGSSTIHPAINRMRSLLPTYSTAFDLGRAGNGSSWNVQYAPSTASDVLQPTAFLLRDWVRSLTTLVIQKTYPSVGGKIGQTSKRPRKKKRRKLSSELDGFIASSDDESDGEHGRNVMNAVLISGPPGCGKTASVFAVAKELDFEVFEVHPGMRRSAKDIFDKVGDMTQNHLVQGVGNGTNAKSDSNIDKDSSKQEIGSGKQGAMNKFFSKTQTSKTRTSPRKTNGKEVEKSKTPMAQKQSMILLEEVDVLFDEDKGFWPGVVNLISQSKRPVVLTCNDETSIPFDDLPLHAVWRYQPPTADIASEYLVALAATEGHILGRDCIRALYESKGQDLRATINELDFWCQMGIGSMKAGLDWMLDHSPTNRSIERTDACLRVFSKDTYASGIGLALPLPVSNYQRQEELLDHAQRYLEIPVTGWHEASDVLHTEQSSPEQLELSKKRIDDLQHAADLLDSRSVLDLFDDTMTAALSVRIATALTPNKTLPRETDVVGAYFTSSAHTSLTKNDLLSALEPMTVEKPTFPPAVGRLAPSFEGPISIVAMDIAPYVRSIVAFDQRLQQQRKALNGDLQGKKMRKTRAARAALEGGSKANTRREMWFSQNTDFKKVLKTAGEGWPLWVPDDAQTAVHRQTWTEASSPEAGATTSDED